MLLTLATIGFMGVFSFVLARAMKKLRPIFRKRGEITAEVTSAEQLSDKQVAEKYTFALRPGANGRHYQGPLYRMPFLSTFGFPMASVASGAKSAASLPSVSSLTTKS